MNGKSLYGRDWMLRLAILALVPAALLACAMDAQAGSNGRKGTEGAPELSIAVGPRGEALGGAVVGDATGVEALFWNPAGAGLLTKTEAMFTHTQYFADMRLNYVGIATRMGGAGVIGFAAKVLSVGDVIVTTEDSPDGTGEIATPTFTVLGLTWAKQFTDRVTFGATANLVSEHIIQQTATGVAFDFGVQYLTGWQGLKLGMVMKNFGPNMTFNGPGSEVSIIPPGSNPTAENRIFNSETASFDLPSFFTLGASMDLFHAPATRLTALGAVQNNNYEGNAIRGGLEWGYRDYVMLRGSYYGTYLGQGNPTTGEDNAKFAGGDDLYTGFALGGGVAMRTGETGRLGVDFTWRPVRQGLFNDIIDVGVHLAF